MRASWTKLIIVGALGFCVVGFSSRLPRTFPADATPLLIEDKSPEHLRQWVGKNFHLFKDSAGVSRVFIRRETVRALIYPSSFGPRDEVVKLISALSEAAGVSYELTSQDANLIIVVDTPINEGDKPNPALWARLGLPKRMYDIVADAESWAPGCGIYTFGNTRGQMALTIAAADSKLSASHLRDCAIDGTIRAFGLRQEERVFLRADEGYAPYVALVRALKVCEDRFGGADALISIAEADQKKKYVDCAAEFLSK